MNLASMILLIIFMKCILSERKSIQVDLHLNLFAAGPAMIPLSALAGCAPDGYRIEFLLARAGQEMQSTQKNMAYGQVGAYVVVVHNSYPPSDEEWDAYLNFGAASGLEEGITTGFLVLTEGGAPTSRQRKMMADRLAPTLQRFPKVFSMAIITPSTFVRGVVTALSVVNPYPLRTFAPNEMEQACDYLGVPRTFLPKVQQMLASLKATLQT